MCVCSPSRAIQSRKSSEKSLIVPAFLFFPCTDQGWFALAQTKVGSLSLSWYGISAHTSDLLSLIWTLFPWAIEIPSPAPLLELHDQCGMLKKVDSKGHARLKSWKWKQHLGVTFMRCWVGCKPHEGCRLFSIFQAKL